MEPATHRFAELFAQLGLPSDGPAIARFIHSHGPLPAGMALADAPFWTPAQAALLKQQLQDDADWAEMVDQLNLALH
jgi:hypothetical protein